MAQTTVLAVGTTAATSTPITVAAGAEVKVGIFATTGAIQYDQCVVIIEDTPGADNQIAVLDSNKTTTVISAAGTYLAVRRASTYACGVFTES